MAPALTGPPAIALAGFMGAGKSSAGRALAARLGRPFVELDAEIERAAGRTPQELFAGEGEAAFRTREAEAARAVLERADAPVIALGGGALGDGGTRRLLAERALTAWLDVPLDVARARAGGDPRRPLAADPQRFAALWEERRPVYAAAADAILDAGEVEVEALARALALGIWTRPGAAALLPALLGERRAVLLADEAVAARIDGPFAARVIVAGGEPAKAPASLERLWRALADAELERRDVVVAAGGGTVTDAAGFAAATFRRGLAWIALPSTLVGQVDAAIGGKTGINVAAKNDVGAFHLPEATLCDPELLATLPARERRAGLAEVVKTALLAGGPLYDLVAAGLGDDAELVRRSAGFKALVVAGDPTERGRRAILNLGHTIGHGVEAAAGLGGLTHGESVAVGLAAAAWLSVRHAGLPASEADGIEQLLAQHGLPTRAPGLDPAAVLDAMRHDKKRERGSHRFVLLEAPGRPVWGVEVPERDVAAAVRRAVAREPAAP